MRLAINIAARRGAGRALTGHSCTAPRRRPLGGTFLRTGSAHGMDIPPRSSRGFPMGSAAGTRSGCPGCQTRPARMHAGRLRSAQAPHDRGGRALGQQGFSGADALAGAPPLACVCAARETPLHPPAAPFVPAWGPPHRLPRRPLPARPRRPCLPPAVWDPLPRRPLPARPRVSLARVQRAVAGRGSGTLRPHAAPTLSRRRPRRPHAAAPLAAPAGLLAT